MENIQICQKSSNFHLPWAEQPHFAIFQRTFLMKILHLHYIFINSLPVGWTNQWISTWNQPIGHTGQKSLKCSNYISFNRFIVKHVHSSAIGRQENCNMLIAHVQYVGAETMASQYAYTISLFDTESRATGHKFQGLGMLH